MYTIVRNVLFNLCVFFIYLAPACSNDDPVFYPEYAGSEVYIAKDCYKYLTDNSVSVSHGLDKLLVAYSESKWNEMDGLLNDYKIDMYIGNLENCFKAYKYIDEVNYFFEAHKEAYLLYDIYKKSIQNKEKSEANIVEMSSKLLDDIEHINISKKIQKPTNKR